MNMPQISRKARNFPREILTSRGRNVEQFNVEKRYIILKLVASAFSIWANPGGQIRKMIFPRLCLAFLGIGHIMVSRHGHQF